MNYKLIMSLSHFLCLQKFWKRLQSTSFLKWTIILIIANGFSLMIHNSGSDIMKINFLPFFSRIRNIRFISNNVWRSTRWVIAASILSQLLVLFIYKSMLWESKCRGQVYVYHFHSIRKAFYQDLFDSHYNYTDLLIHHLKSLCKICEIFPNKSKWWIFRKMIPFHIYSNDFPSSSSTTDWIRKMLMC